MPTPSTVVAKMSATVKPVGVLENVVENAVHDAISQQVARSSLLRSQVDPAQYADAGSGKLTTAKPVNKPASQANLEHAKTLAVTLHWADEVAPIVAVLF
jgi:hypothetical protein